MEGMLKCAVQRALARGEHIKGCNCKNSRCLKKYCECFQASIYCSDNCKCIDCKNFEVWPSPAYHAHCPISILALYKC